MEIWTDVTYANWMQHNGVPELRCCLARCKYDGSSKTHRPNELIAISKDLDGDDLIAPKDGKYYVKLWYRKSTGDGYIIGGSGMEFKS